MSNEKLFLDNEKLIYYVLKRYFPHIYYDSESRDDYYQIGAIGLMKACNNFDSSISKFATYAVPMIWGELKKEIRCNKTHIHYSRPIIDIANKIFHNYQNDKTNDDYNDYLNKTLSNLDISYSDKIGVMNYFLDIISLNTTIDSGSDDELTLEQTIPDAVCIDENIEFFDYLHNVKNKLKNEKEEKIFDMMLNDIPQQIIANTINMTQSYVSRIEFKIKMHTIKELYDTGYYDLALNKLYEICKKRKITLKQLCKKYKINLLDIHLNYIADKDALNINKNVNKIYSIKSCYTLILKCIMKLLLKNENTNNYNNLKLKIKNLLLKLNYSNDSLIEYLSNLSDNQLNDFIILAKNTIKKYNYKYDYEIIINESEINHSVINISNTMNYLPKFKHDCTINQIIKLLETFKIDNLKLKFQL